MDGVELAVQKVLMYNSAVLMWIVSHLPSLIGASGIIIAVYKFIGFLFKAGRIATVVEQRVLKAEETVYRMESNHLTHLQAAAEESNKHLIALNHKFELWLAKQGIISES